MAGGLGSLNIQINAILNTQQSTQSVKNSAKLIEQEVNKTPMQLKVEMSTGVLKQQAVEVNKEYKQMFSSIMKEHDAMQNDIAKTASNNIKRREEEEKKLASILNKNADENYSQQLKAEQLEKDKLIATNKQNEVLRQQIALYKEQKAIQIQNLQSSFDYSKYSSSSIKGQVSSIQGDLIGFNPATVEEYTSQTQKMNTALNQTKANLNTAKSEAQGFGSVLSNDISKMFQWTAAATLIFGALNALKQGIQDVIDLNTNLTQTATAMNTTVEKLGAIATGAQQMSIAMGSNINDVLQIMHVYANINETADSIIKKTKADVILSNITGMNGTETTNTLQAIQQQFNLTDDQLMHVDDSLMKIASNLRMNYQTAIKEISDGVKTAGTMAQQSGLSFEQFSGIIAKTAESTRRSGSEIANATKMIFARVGQIKSPDVEVTGEDTSNAAKALKSIGVDTLDQQTHQLRNMYDILGDVAGKWQGLTADEKAYVANQAAGVRQFSIFESIMNGWSKSTDLATQALDSNGYALKQQETYMQSTEAKVKTLQSTMVSMWQNTISSQGINTFISAINGILNGIASLTKTFGLLPTVITTAYVVLAIFNKELLTTIGAKAGTLLTGLISSFKSLATAEGIAALGATALNAALTLGLSVAITALISGITILFNHLANGVNEQKQKVDDLTSKFTSLKDEITKLRELQNPTEDQKTQLQLLEREYQLQEALLQKEKERLAQKEVFGKGVWGQGLSGDIQQQIELYNTLEKAIKATQDDAVMKQQNGYDASYDIQHIKDLKAQLLDVENFFVNSKQKLLDYSKTTSGQTKTDIDGLISSIDTILPKLEQQNNTIMATNNSTSNLHKAFASVADDEKVFTKSVSDADTAFKNSVTDVEALTSAQKELGDNHKLSSKTLQALVEKYPELIQYMGDEATLSDELSKLTKSEQENQKLLYEAKLDLSTDFFNKLIKGNTDTWNAVSNAYGKDADNFKTVADAKLVTNNLLVSAIGSSWSKLYSTQEEALQSVIDYAQEGGISAIITQQDLDNAEKAKKQLAAIKAINDPIKLTLDKIDFKTLDTKDIKSPTASSPLDKQPDFLKADIDRYTDLQSAIDEVTNAVSKLKAEQEGLEGQALIDNLNKQIEANQKLAKAKNDLLWEQEKERNDLRYNMEQQGFNFTGDFSSTNMSTNYADTLKSMYDTYNNMAYKTEAEKQARADMLTLIKQMEESYKRILQLNKDTYTSENDITNISKENNKNKAEQVKIQKDLNDALKKTTDEYYKQQKTQLDSDKKDIQDIVDLTVKMIKQQKNDELSAYKDIIDAKKTSLDITEKEIEYQQTLADKEKGISTDQNRLTELDRDNSLSAQAEKLKLKDDLATKQKDLATEQRKHGVEEQKKALDDDYTAFEKKTKDYLSQEGKILSDARAMVDSQSTSVYTGLITWNTKYGTSINSDITNSWTKATSALQKYKDANDKINSTSALNTIDKKLTTNTDISNAMSGSGATYNEQNIVAEMKANSAEWLNASVSRQLELHNINAGLGASIGAIYNDDAGRWYKNSVPLYHSGIEAGFVGGKALNTSNEQFAKLLKGELVINSQQMNLAMQNLLPQLSNNLQPTSNMNNGGISISMPISVAGNLDKTVLPNIESIVNQAVTKINNAMNLRGNRRTVGSFGQ